MVVRIQCPECGKRYKGDESLLGRKTNCKQCGNVITVSAAEGETLLVLGAAGGVFGVRCSLFRGATATPLLNTEH